MQKFKALAVHCTHLPGEKSSEKAVYSKFTVAQLFKHMCVHV